MAKADLARAAFLFLPLVLLGLLVLPGRMRLRLPLSLVIAAVVALALPMLLPRGALTYLASFSTMAP